MKKRICLRGGFQLSALLISSCSMLRNERGEEMHTLSHRPERARSGTRLSNRYGDESISFKHIHYDREKDNSHSKRAIQQKRVKRETSITARDVRKMSLVVSARLSVAIVVTRVFAQLGCVEPCCCAPPAAVLVVVFAVPACNAVC